MPHNWENIVRRILLALSFLLVSSAHADGIFKNLTIDLTAHIADECSRHSVVLPYVHTGPTRDNYFNSFPQSQPSLVSCAHAQEPEVFSHLYRYKATTWMRLDKSPATRTRMIGLGFEFSANDSSTRFGIRGQRIIFTYVLVKNIL